MKKFTFRCVFNKKEKIYYIQRKYWLLGWRYLERTKNFYEIVLSEKISSDNEESLFRIIKRDWVRKNPNRYNFIQYPTIIIKL